MTIMWIIIMLLVIALAIAGLFYLITRIAKFSFINTLARDRKWIKYTISAVIVVVSILLLWAVFGYVNMCVIQLSCTFLWLISDLIMYFIRKTKFYKYSGKLYLTGIIALIATLVYLGAGWYLAHSVAVTNYTIETEKSVENIRVVLIADSHVSTVFTGQTLAKEIEKIQDCNPDLIIFSGDFVDGSSKFEDMTMVANALGSIETKYGTYFSYGNHDKNIYGEDSRRGFTSADLANELAKNGITILEDEVLSLENGYSIIGRADASNPSRLPISELMSKVKADDFIIDINHQPNDYANEANSGVDLVLSGHTHGGQLFPINNVGILIGAVDREYGYEKRNNTNFIVTSGIADWAVDFKTGCRSEYVVIDIVPVKEN